MQHTKPPWHLLPLIFISKQRAKKYQYRDPELALFARLRFQFVLWSSCVLGGMLLVIVVLLSFSVPRLFAYTTQSDLSAQSEHMAQRWQAHPQQTCPISIDATKYMVACYDAHGKLLKVAGNSVAQKFLKYPLFPTVNHGDRNSDDSIPTADGLTILYRHALTVTAPQGHGILGTIQMGTYTSSPQILVLITFIVGIVLLVLICAPLVSITLANRAIAPAVLAFKRQQDFIANASHELRTPLSLLRADAEFLLRSRNRLEPDDVELLEDIVSEASYMTTLANNMLTLARMDAEQYHLEQEVIDLAEVIGSLTQRIRPMMRDQQLALEVATIPNALVLGDRFQIEQALLILLDNAIKYNKLNGQVLIQLSLADNSVYVEIKDTGIGIAAEHLPRLGTRFYRVDKARSREQGGNGLGLSIVRGIVHAHNGKLEILSQIEKGTTVQIQLPLLRQNPLPTLGFPILKQDVPEKA
ncbi:sensor histidine kinase [Dictyobacter kobayashii]|uniref:histidine kinase n=1 Tax=Dictyobacter kobayashii TaxID=2014872 RepID=A0A402AWS1_9CHLR|nr:ATP-binding protein [Dictyobacter kobayashii]GCE23526.1 hypothetical protein KDK_73260 [Dictyobacter kobayashii]